jgi:hypothetical protein
MSKKSKRHCLVKGCLNGGDGGEYHSPDLCAPCYEMLTTGRIHLSNPTFIGDLNRKYITLISAGRAVLRAMHEVSIV